MSTVDFTGRLTRPDGTTAPLAASAPIAAATAMVGMSMEHNVGESWPAARARYDAAYGDATHKPIQRSYDGGLPALADWGAVIPTDRSAVISCKPDPTQFLAGAYDTLFTGWLSAAPAGRPYWVGVWHEPENPSKPFQTAAQKQQYRDMWSHFSDLVLSVGNPLLRRTLKLMDWTLAAASGRNYRDWFQPGAVDVIGWDQYDYQDGVGGLRTEAQHQAARPAVATSLSEGVGYAVAEFGVKFDITPAIPDATRAAWLPDTVAAMKANGAEFVTLFASNVGGTFMLDGHPSVQAAWRSVVTGA